MVSGARAFASPASPHPPCASLQALTAQARAHGFLELAQGLDEVDVARAKLAHPDKNEPHPHTPEEVRATVSQTTVVL